jgi:hypothetical protein
MRFLLRVEGLAFAMELELRFEPGDDRFQGEGRWHRDLLQRCE